MGPDRPSSAEARIRALIAERGRITFHDFMAVAVDAYYAAHRPGRDFQTAPRTSPAFGHLVGQGLARMWRALGSPVRFVAAEVGAGDGRLAADACAYLGAREPEMVAAATYVAIDRRPPPAAGGFRSAGGEAGAVPLRPFVGCVLSNELFDALPVHRLVGGDGELWVTEHDGRLVAEPGELSSAALAELAPPLRPRQVADVAPTAAAVYRGLCDALSAGFVLTIDYGGMGEELFGPHRMAGTLVAYSGHRAHDDPLAAPGGQDLTAHVDFGRLIAAGEAAGLRTVLYTTQRDFLLGLGLRDWLGRLDPTRLSPADLFNARLAAEELVRGDRLGKLRVLVQAKGVDAGPELFG